jgi:hypothetical protein
MTAETQMPDRSYRSSEAVYAAGLFGVAPTEMFRGTPAGATERPAEDGKPSLRGNNPDDALRFNPAGPLPSRVARPHTSIGAPKAKFGVGDHIAGLCRSYT